MNESKIGITERLRREGRWDEASKFKDEALKELRSNGMKRDEASESAWDAMEQAYPPTPMATVGQVATVVEADTRVQGLSDLPATWPELPDNASLQAELSWVQSNRLRIVEESTSGITKVHLGRARTPAPSWAALGWLETSIRAYSKYIDIVAKALKDEEVEQTMVKRERLAIDKVRSLLAEMIDEPV